MSADYADDNEGYDSTDDEGNYDEENTEQGQEQQGQEPKQGQEQQGQEPKQEENKKQSDGENNKNNDDNQINYNDLIREGFEVYGDARYPTLLRVIEGAINAKKKNQDIKAVKEFCRDWNQRCCKPEPLPEQKFEDGWDFIINKKERETEQKNQFYDDFFNNKPDKELLENLFPELKGSIYYRTNVNPAKFIVAFKATGHIIEIEAGLSRSWKEGILELERTTKHNRTFLMCIPTEITRHINPFRDVEAEESAPKCSIKFVDQKGEEHTFAHKTLSGIISILKDHNYVFGDGAESALSAIILGFNQMGKLRNNNDVDVEGFFIEKENGKIKPSKIGDIREPNAADLASALDFIDELTKYYGDNRLDLLATSLVWGIVAPIIFIVKTNEYYLEALYLYGFSNSLKTTTGKIILAIDGHHNDPKYALKYTHMDTVAKFGNKISKTTFPILMDEVILTNTGNKDRDREKLINVIKIAIDSKMVRQKFEYSTDTNTIPIPALSPLILTSESPPPTHSAGAMKRMMPRHHTQLESRNPEDPESIAFKEFMRVNLDRLGALGKFRNWYVMNNQEYILDEKRPPPLDIGYEILKKIYEYAGKQVPEWLSRRLPRNQLEEAAQDNALLVKNAFIKYINDTYARATHTWKASDHPFGFQKSVSYRLKELGESNLITDVKIKINKTKDGSDGFTAIIGRGILEEIYNQPGISHDQCPHLIQLAQYMGVDKGPDGYHTSNGLMKIHINQKKLFEYFGDEE